MIIVICVYSTHIRMCVYGIEAQISCHAIRQSGALIRGLNLETRTLS